MSPCYKYEVKAVFDGLIGILCIFKTSAAPRLVIGRREVSVKGSPSKNLEFYFHFSLLNPLAAIFLFLQNLDT